ncbi:hypothetical protein FOMPIDRAFT_1056398 [Fomitopsis schrenkii]|uniref:Uncharacterized protein n=1 Tax=Fomitopsis schrenkii TaxID=2126942 RepID=S8DNQ5_FOMSC|nr:hypothetical protein FOMPIDRAFT_1056398 [Fomitopsis schrenkii]
MPSTLQRPTNGDGEEEEEEEGDEDEHEWHSDDDTYPSGPRPSTTSRAVSAYPYVLSLPLSPRNAITRRRRSPSIRTQSTTSSYGEGFANAAVSSSLPGLHSNSSMATRSGSGSYSDPEESSSSPSGGSSPTSSEASTGKGGEDQHERVINIKVRSLCHRLRLNKNSEVDAHIATCASQDWSTVDQVKVGNFVTAS